MVDKIWTDDKDEGIELGIIDDASEYKPLSEDAVKTLAQSIIRGEVFGSWQITEDSTVSIEQVFLFLLLLDEMTMKRVVRDGTSHIYEYIKEAAPMAVNGYPMFYSGFWMNKTDFQRVMENVGQMEKAIDQA
jgi:hypothetical protein